MPSFWKRMQSNIPSIKIRNADLVRAPGAEITQTSTNPILSSLLLLISNFLPWKPIKQCSGTFHVKFQAEESTFGMSRAKDLEFSDRYRRIVIRWLKNKIRTVLEWEWQGLQLLFYEKNCPDTFKNFDNHRAQDQGDQLGGLLQVQTPPCGTSNESPSPPLSFETMSIHFEGHWHLQGHPDQVH